MRVVGSCVIVLAACYAPSAPAGVACGPNETCPTGQACVAGFCGGGPGADAPGDDAAPPDPDAMPDAGPMLLFATPARVPQLSGPNDDFSPSISADGLEIYLNRNDGGSTDHKIYVATRAAVQDTFGGLALVGATDLPSTEEYDGDISSDRKELVFVGDGAQTVVQHITRPAVAGAWGLPLLTGIAGRQGTSLCGNDLRLFVSGGGIHEYARPGINMGPWMLVRSHDNLDEHGYPGPSADCLEIFTARAGRIYRSTRAAIDQPFGEPQRVLFGGAFDGYDLADPEVSADGATLYLSIDDNGSTGYDIFVTTR